MCKSSKFFALFIQLCIVKVPMGSESGENFPDPDPNSDPQPCRYQYLLKGVVIYFGRSVLELKCDVNKENIFYPQFITNSEVTGTASKLWNPDLEPH